MSKNVQDIEQTHEDNRIDFKMQMTLFVHDMPEIQRPRAMDTAAFMQATEIYNKVTEMREWLLKSIDNL